MSVLSLLNDTVLFSGQNKYGGSIGFTLDRTVAWPSIVSTAALSANAVAWSSDGKFFYTVENRTLKQYGLKYVYGPVEDAVTVVETSENVLDYVPTSIAVSPDGTKLYLSYLNSVNEYVLGTPYSLTDITFNGQLVLSNTNIVFNERNIRSLRLSQDGTKVYVFGADTSSIYQINLANSYQISSAGNINTQFTLSRANPNGFTFSNSGSSFYVVSDSAWIDQYNTRTPFSTTGGNLVGSFQVTSNYISGVNPALTSIMASNDGTKLFVSDSTNSGFWQVDLSVPYRLTSASITSNLLISPYLYNTNMGALLYPYDVDFNPSGTKMFVLDNWTDNVVEYNLSTAYNPNTAVFANAFSIASQENDSRGFYFGNAGYSFYVVGRQGADITQYNMAQPYNANTATFANVNYYSWHVPSASYKSWTTSEITGDSGKITFSNDGNTLILTGYTTGANMLPVSLRRPWDLSTIVNGSTPLMTASPLHVKLSNDGKTMYVLYSSNIHQYSLWVPWEPGSATYQKHYSTSSYETNLTSLEFSDDGTSMYISGKASNSIVRLSLASPWDIGNPSFVSNLYLDTVASNVNSVSAIFWRPGGQSLYVLSDLRDRIYQYNLGTAWDTTTASNTFSQFVGTFSKAQDLHFAPDGFRIYTVWQAPTYGGYISFWRSPNAWILNSPPVYQSTYNLGGNFTPTEAGLTGIDFSTDGTRLITVGTTTSHARKYFLHLPFDFAFPYVSGRKNPTANYPYGVDWSPSGNSLYMHMSSITYDYDANVPFDFHSVNFANVASRYYPYIHASDPYGFKARDRFIFHVTSGRYVSRTEFETPSPGRDISLNKIAGSFSRVPINAAEAPAGMEFSEDGSNLFYVVGTTLTQVPLSSPWNFKTMANVSAQTYTLSGMTVGGTAETTFTGMTFVNGGSNIILSGGSRGAIYDLRLATPFSLTGASYGANSFSNISYLNGVTNSMQEVEMGGSSNTMYVLSKNDRRIYRFFDPSPNTAVGVRFTDYTGSQILNLANVESLPANTSANTKGLTFDFSIDGTDLFYVPARGLDLTTANTRILQYAVPSSAAWDIGSFNPDSPIATANVNRYGLGNVQDFKIASTGRQFLLAGTQKLIQVENLPTSQTFTNRTIYSNPSNIPNYVYASYALIAGGGGTGVISGGGGGGGVLIGNVLLNTSISSYTVTVGAGGSGGTDPSASNGGNTSFLGVVAVGGGRAISGASGGFPGGSGGGASSTINALGGLGRVNQGFRGGNAATSPNPSGLVYTGGGGGAGNVGIGVGVTVPGTDLAFGAGGTGKLVTVAPKDYGQFGTGIDSTLGPASVTGRFFGGGGGGGMQRYSPDGTNPGGIAGLGGGGTGGNYYTPVPGQFFGTRSGNTNSGGGAGGGAFASNTVFQGKSGGSGLAIIYYNSSNVLFSGGDVTIDTAQTTVQVRHVFASSGQLVPLANAAPIIDARILIVGGGGGGGGGPAPSGPGAGARGGGGAGGLQVANISISTQSGYTVNVIVGGGGAHTTNGTPTRFSQYEASGGGGGGGVPSFGYGRDGGSGGGLGYAPATGEGRGNVAGVFPWEGYPGGRQGGSTAIGGGGGGAGAVGGDGTGPAGWGGAGGTGALINWVPGTVGQPNPSGQYFAGGGGGYGGSLSGPRGLGGGGRGGGPVPALAGNVNSGGGGGGDFSSPDANLLGGSGVVIIRYSGNARFTGGIVESANGFTFHIFTSSNTFTAI